MTPRTHAAERRMLVEASRHLSARGLSPGSSGNISFRVDDVILMTPTGSSLSRLTEDDLAVVPLSGGSRPLQVAGPRPSKELPLHLAAYAARTEVRAVVHLHSPFATALSCLPVGEAGYAALPPLTPYRVMRLGNVPVSEYATPGGAALAAGVGELAAAHDAILLANHGPVLLGRDLESASDLAEELETAAQVTFLVGDLAYRRLPEGEVDRLRARP